MNDREEYVEAGRQVARRVAVGISRPWMRSLFLGENGMLLPLSTTFVSTVTSGNHGASR
jgi:hypothetical protein